MSRPRLIVVAGPNGAGKTSITEAVLRHQWMHGCEYVNPDNIARDEFGDWNSLDAVLKAANLAAERRENCLQQSNDLASETVLSSPDKVDFVLRAAQAGFFVRLFFVGTRDATINAARIARRVMEGGHEVPIGKIISRCGKSIANCAQLESVVDRLYVYDNSVDNASPQLCFRASEGQLNKRYLPVPDWAQSIFERVPATPPSA
ncbi:MAG: AAA family ATPase [Betaproteobacteria bacterium]|nr:MAG: AAA family ATPase [Betaproteobacteria bacterium]